MSEVANGHLAIRVAGVMVHETAYAAGTYAAEE